MGKKERHAQERAIDLETRRLAKEAEREARRLAWQTRHDIELADRREERRVIREQRVDVEDAFVVDMSRRMGLTPQEFRALQEQRRSEMDDINRKGDIAQQMAHLTPIDGQVH